MPCVLSARYKEISALLEARAGSPERAKYNRLVDIAQDAGVSLTWLRNVSSIPYRGKAALFEQLALTLGVPLKRIAYEDERAEELLNRMVGRENDLAVLDRLWVEKETPLAVIKGVRGEGKTKLVEAFLAPRSKARVFRWDFRISTSLDAFFSRLSQFLSLANCEGDSIRHAEDCARAILTSNQAQLVAVDSFEVLLDSSGVIEDVRVHSFVRTLLSEFRSPSQALVILTSRSDLELLSAYPRSFHPIELEARSLQDAASLMRGFLEVAHCDHPQSIDPALLEDFVRSVGRHTLTLKLAAAHIGDRQSPSHDANRMLATLTFERLGTTEILGHLSADLDRHEVMLLQELSCCHNREGLRLLPKLFAALSEEAGTPTPSLLRNPRTFRKAGHHAFL